MCHMTISETVISRINSLFISLTISKCISRIFLKSASFLNDLSCDIPAACLFGNTALKLSASYTETSELSITEKRFWYKNKYVNESTV